MSDTPKNALSEQEWADELRTITHVDPSLMARMTALCNHALPPDSPYKITRADVDLLRADFDELADRGGGTARAFGLLAKLAALLPPSDV